MTMSEIIFTSAEGSTRTLPISDGESVMHVAVRNGVEGIVGECGGVLSCATCHVFVDPSDLARIEPMGDLEDELLDGAAEDRQDCSRLSCQIKVAESFGTLHITTPEYQN